LGGPMKHPPLSCPELSGAFLVLLVNPLSSEVPHQPSHHQLNPGVNQSSIPNQKEIIFKLLGQ
jgi:hypothetical protein